MANGQLDMERIPHLKLKNVAWNTTLQGTERHKNDLCVYEYYSKQIRQTTWGRIYHDIIIKKNSVILPMNLYLVYVDVI